MLFGEGPQIKNIAADLNKLFRQGSLLNQIGQTVEGDSTADQGTSDLLAARDPVIQEISVGMSGEQSARYTVSGTPPLSLPNSLGKPLKAWSVSLTPYQEGTGDPSPDNVRPIHGTDKVNLFVEESYDQSATPKAVITLPQTVYTGTIGSEGGESRWVKQTLIATGRNVNVYSYGGMNGIHITNVLSEAGTRLVGISNMSNSVGNYYTSGTIWLGVGDKNCYWLGIMDTLGFSDIADMRTWLDNHPLEICYPLNNPSTFTITTPTIPTPTGTATTWATAEDGVVDSMEVTYVGKT